MNREQKEQLVAEMRDTLDSGIETLVVVKQSGLTVSEVTALRKDCHHAGVGFKVVKNRLMKIALQGTRFAGLSEHFVGTTAVAYSNDPVAAAKAVVDFAKSNEKLSVIAGHMGEKPLAETDVKALASLPSLDALRGKLVGVLQAPAGKLVGVTNAPAGQLARVFAAYAEK